MAGDRRARYEQLLRRLDALCEGESDPISLMATVCCELFSTFRRFHWVGFYRNVGGSILKVGPYQGGHGCLVIPFHRGVCGRCATEGRLQNVPDVRALDHHIACSSTTRSELVLPVFDREGKLLAVLDIDSDLPAAFDAVDEQLLARVGDIFRRC